MRVNNATYKAVKMKWSGITFPLKEGTPVNIGGNVANDGTAIGLVAGTVYVEPVASDGLYILVGGDVELAEVEKKSGITLASAAKAAMSGIRFYKPNGSVDDSADSTPGPATADEPGIMKQAENIPELTSDSNTIALLREDINTLLAALKEAGIMEADPEPEPDPEEDGEEES